MEKLKMDLHIHTPASKCYLEENTDEQYLKILEKAVEENLGIIAITDHNTVAGYQRLFEIKEKLKAEKLALLPFKEKTIEISERIGKIDETLNLYSKIWIIAGVEYTLNPGIHLIVLSAKDEISDLLALLDEIGYTNDKRGYDSEFVPNIDVKNFLNNPRLANKIVIAPHVDSGQGIYNDLKGLYRAAIFKDSKILAITCNSIKQLEKIQGMVKNDPNYKRERPWAYINASDAHCVSDIGKKVSFIKIENRKFEKLLEAFQDATEYISDVENEEITELIEKLVKSQKTILIDMLSEDNYELAKILCACINSDYHSVILGVNDKREILGINITPETMEKQVENMQETLANINNISLGILDESLGNGRYVYIIFIRNIINKLCFIKDKDEVYVYEKKIRKTTVLEIEQIVKKRLLSDLERFHRNNDDTIEQIKNNMLTLQQPIGRYKLARAIEDNARKLSKVVDEVKPMNTTHYFGKWEKINYGLGNSTGNLCFARNESIRLEDAVLRYTCPRINEKNIFLEENPSELTKIEKACIVITEFGATYLIDKWNENTYIGGNGKFIILYLEKYMKEYSIYSLMAWLKSSLFIWYMLKTAGELQLYNPYVFKQIIFPCIPAMKEGSEIEKKAKEIIVKEWGFLNEIEKFDENSNEEEYVNKINDLVDEHNGVIQGLSTQIDEMFFNAMDVNECQRKIIIEDLNASDVFNYLV